MTSAARLCALAARDSYRNRAFQVGNRMALGSEDWQIFDYAADPSGFHATAYRHPETGRIIIAFRGTDPRHPVTQLHDLCADITLATRGYSPQAASALAFAQRVLDMAGEMGLDRKDVLLTGHSAGGTLAQIVSHRLDVRGHTFNAYGAAGANGTPAGGAGRIINHVVATDVIAAASRHYGTVRIYATYADAAALRAAGYPSRGSVWRVAARRFTRAHDICNFAPDVGQPSILSPSALARARRHAPVIAQFRRQAFRTREMLAGLSGIPFTPIWLLASAAYALETLGAARAAAGRCVARVLDWTSALCLRAASASDHHQFMARLGHAAAFFAEVLVPSGRRQMLLPSMVVKQPPLPPPLPPSLAAARQRRPTDRMTATPAIPATRPRRLSNHG